MYSSRNVLPPVRFRGQRRKTFLFLAGFGPDRAREETTEGGRGGRRRWGAKGKRQWGVRAKGTRGFIEEGKGPLVFTPPFNISTTTTMDSCCIVSIFSHTRLHLFSSSYVAFLFLFPLFPSPSSLNNSSKILAKYSSPSTLFAGLTNIFLGCKERSRGESNPIRD